MQKSVQESEKKGLVGGGVMSGEERDPPTPHYMHDFQKKGLTKWAIRKRLILKAMILLVSVEPELRTRLRAEEKREQAPALHT